MGDTVTAVFEKCSLTHAVMSSLYPWPQPPHLQKEPRGSVPLWEKKAIGELGPWSLKLLPTFPLPGRLPSTQRIWNPAHQARNSECLLPWRADISEEGRDSAP